jgi:hypothetical protein
MKHGKRCMIGIAGAGLLFANPSLAQEQARPGRVAETAVGEAGQRQTTAEVLADPMARINTRIPNRVQSRIRNRLDRYYDPQANATSPFEAAADQVQTAGSRNER